MIYYHNGGRSFCPNTLCWCCRNIYGRCSWMQKEHIPVEGWDAVRRDIPIVDNSINRPGNRKTESYAVLRCPLFSLDPRCVDEYKLEYHDFLPREDEATVYVIENKVFRSGEDGGIGAQVPLSTVKEWASLPEYTPIEYLEGPLFAYFKPPASNDIEPYSELGVSVYAGATVDLIQQADEQWQQLRREYKTGKRRMLIDHGVMDASQADDEIYEYGTFNDPNFFQFINPEIRDDPLYNGFQRILQRVEFNVGLAFGTISDPQSVEKTATEILAAKQRQFVTEKSIQTAFQSALDDLVYAINAWCDLAQLAPAGTYSVDYNWGDGVLDDPETRRQDMALDMQRVAAGLMTDVAFVMKWDKVDEEAARKMLPGMEDLTTEEQEEIE